MILFLLCLGVPVKKKKASLKNNSLRCPLGKSWKLSASLRRKNIEFNKFIPDSTRFELTMYDDKTVSQSLFLESRSTKTRSNRDSRGEATPMFTVNGCSGSYLPFGFAVAKIEHLVWSLVTTPESRQNRLTVWDWRKQKKAFSLKKHQLRRWAVYQD